MESNDNQVLILCYHSANILGNEYHLNDHIALEADLRELARLGCLMVPLDEVTQWYRSKCLPTHWSGKRVISLTCDDGTNYDYYDYEHERYGYQKSFFNILQNALQYPEFSRPNCHLHMTSFVIASPYARTVMDKTSMAGLGRWTDDWWAEAQKSPIFSIANHSWDHCSVSIPRVAQRNQIKGTFKSVDTEGDANRQIRNASSYIKWLVGDGIGRHFAYPYGESSNYLVSEYFPRFGEKIGIDAAYITANRYATNTCSRWEIPRYVCGDGWKSSNEFSQLIDCLRPITIDS